jgi:hypothetical protein
VVEARLEDRAVMRWSVAYPASDYPPDEGDNEAAQNCEAPGCRIEERIVDIDTECCGGDPPAEQGTQDTGEEGDEDAAGLFAGQYGARDGACDESE